MYGRLWVFSSSSISFGGSWLLELAGLLVGEWWMWSHQVTDRGHHPKPQKHLSITFSFKRYWISSCKYQFSKITVYDFVIFTLIISIPIFNFFQYNISTMNCFCSYSHFIIIFFPFKFWFEPIGFSTAKTIFFSSGCRVYYVGNHKNQTYRQVYWLIWFSKQTKYNDQMDPPTDFKWMDFLSTILCIFNDVSTVIDVYMKIIFHLKSKNVFSSSSSFEK